MFDRGPSRGSAQMTPSHERPLAVLGLGALALVLSLLTSACVSGSSSGASSGAHFDDYDSDDDNTLQRSEWDQTYDDMDRDRDGVVTREEFNAGFHGGGRR